MPPDPSTSKHNLETALAMVRALDEKFTLLLAAAAELSRQKFMDAGLAVTTAMASAEKAVGKAAAVNAPRAAKAGRVRRARDDLPGRRFLPTHRNRRSPSSRCAALAASRWTCGVRSGRTASPGCRPRPSPAISRA